VHSNRLPNCGGNYCQNAALHHYAMATKKVCVISELLIMVQESIYCQAGLTIISQKKLHYTYKSQESMFKIDRFLSVFTIA
jgi:hypothetical protein